MMRVLVVEDDNKIASFITKGLKQEHIQAERAADGEQGLELVRSRTFDVLIVDLMLPGMDGYTLIERLRAAHVSTPVLILSAKGGLDDKLAGFRAGSDDYLTASEIIQS